MPGYQENPEGYIVFEDGGTSPLAYGASEEWFSTYNEAVKEAMKIVSDRLEMIKEQLDCNSVIVYEGSKEILRSSHSIPRRIKEWFFIGQTMENFKLSVY